MSVHSQTGAIQGSAAFELAPQMSRGTAARLLKPVATACRKIARILWAACRGLFRILFETQIDDTRLQRARDDAYLFAGRINGQHGYWRGGGF